MRNTCAIGQFIFESPEDIHVTAESFQAFALIRACGAKRLWEACEDHVSQVSTREARITTVLVWFHQSMKPLGKAYINITKYRNCLRRTIRVLRVIMYVLSCKKRECACNESDVDSLSMFGPAPQR